MAATDDAEAALFQRPLALPEVVFTACGANKERLIGPDAGRRASLHRRHCFHPPPGDPRIRAVHPGHSIDNEDHAMTMPRANSAHAANTQLSTLLELGQTTPAQHKLRIGDEGFRTSAKGSGTGAKEFFFDTVSKRRAEVADRLEAIAQHATPDTAGTVDRLRDLTDQARVRDIVAADLQQLSGPALAESRFSHPQHGDLSIVARNAGDRAVAFTLQLRSPDGTTGRVQQTMGFEDDTAAGGDAPYSGKRTFGTGDIEVDNSRFTNRPEDDLRYKGVGTALMRCAADVAQKGDAAFVTIETATNGAIHAMCQGSGMQAYNGDHYYATPAEVAQACDARLGAKGWISQT